MESYWATIKYKPSPDNEERFSQHLGMIHLAEKHNSWGSCGDGREKDIFSFGRKEALDDFLRDIERLEFVDSVKTKVVQSRI